MVLGLGLSRDKRGVFFTLSSILFVAALFLLFSGDYASPPPDTAAVTIDATNAFRAKVEDTYVPLVLREHSYQALVALSQDAQQQGIYLRLPQDFASILKNGTYMGSAGPLKTVTGFQTLPQAFGNLSLAAAQIGFNVTFGLQNITVLQTGAFQAAYIANVSFNLSSRDGTVGFNRTIIIQDSFSLIGVPDLYYNRNRPAAWNENLTLQLYRPRSWNNSEFLAMANGRLYSTNSNASSFFSRLQGSTAPSAYGVETVVPVAVTPAPNLTSMDIQYFQGIDQDCRYTLVSYPSLRMDLPALVRYNISGAQLLAGSPAFCAPAP